MAGFRILDDNEQPPSGGFRILDDVPVQKDPGIGKPEELTFGEKLVQGVTLPSWLQDILPNRGSRVGGWMQGMADNAVGAVQTVANVLPDSTGIPQFVNKGVADEEAKYQAARKAEGRTGFDAARTVGNVTSLVNLVAGGTLGAAETFGARALQGAGMGAAAGAMAPVEDTSNGFWGKKAGQVVTGAVTGGVLTPALGAAAEVAMRKLGLGASPNIRASTHDVDSAVVDALKETGQSMQDIPPDQLQALRTQVSTALSGGKTINAAAALRKGDFDALNMDGTLGQITREPMQFAREQNLRGVEGVGEPLSARFADQGNQLQSILPAGGGKPAYQAGTQISESLAALDDKLRKHVSGLYGEARASAGKDLDVPLQGLAQDYADILHRYGDKVPSGVKNVLGDYGLGGATQTKVFNFEEADKVLKAINANRSIDPATNAALSELRGALRKTVEGVDTAGGPFAPAVRGAAERFKMQDAIPALKAASNGSVAPDDFVRRFVVGGKTDEVRGLAQVLKASDPASFQEARAQVADELRRAAFGEVNGATGDAPFSPTRYMATIRRLGPDKLSAFFSPQEVADIMRVGRVGAYIKSAPNASAVNTSNTAGALLNLASKVPGVSPMLTLGNRAVGAVKNSNAIRDALAAEVPVGAAPLNDTQRNWLAYILAGGAAPGFLAARAIGQ